jgi:hypothetical protein
VNTRVNGRHALALCTSLRLVGWLPTVLCALGVLLLWLLNATTWREGTPLVSTVRVVEVIVPLAAGIQAAFLLSPEDEPCLELLLAYPRPIRCALLERIWVMAALTGSIALPGSLIQPEDVVLALVRWVSPAAWFCGIAVFTALLTRQGTFGALLVTLLWGGTLFGGDALLARWPHLWPLHAYLRPGDVLSAVYALNRGVLILVGLLLTALAAHLAGDPERMLGIRTQRPVTR